eukprot:snap_masked-scaffold_1-processed-gene-4.37-mRNA-1 protein AED:1.00 eAED:1.00 QI:0/0/0/0/1/1/2/0/396
MKNERSLSQVLRLLRAVCAIIVVLHHLPALNPWLVTSDKAFLGKLVKSREFMFREPTGAMKKAVQRPFHGAPPNSHEISMNEDWFSYLLLAGVGPGKIAVEVFLVLSGFLFALNFGKYDERQSHEAIFACVYRVPRLLISLGPLQVTNFLLYWNGYTYGNFNSFPNSQLIVNSYLTGVQGLWASELNGALWILPWFLLSPVFILVLHNLWNELLPTKTTFVGNFKDEGTISYFLSIFLGFLLCKFQNSKISQVHVILLMVVVSSPWFPMFYASRYTRIMCGTSLVALSLYFKQNYIIWRVASSKLVKFIAEISYQLYLWHLVVFNTFGASIYPSIVRSKNGLLILLYNTSAFVVALFISTLAHYYIEVPSGKFFKRITKQLFPKKLQNEVEGKEIV